MGINQSIFKQVLSKFDKKRVQASSDLEKRKQEVYLSLPRIKEIDKSLFETGLKISKAILNDPSSSVSLLAKIEKETTSLEKEKKDLLKANGYANDYLFLKYNCKKCNDAGFINNKPCTCFEQELVQLAYNNSNIKEILADENFDNFVFDYYTDEKYPDKKFSPRDNIQRIYQVAHDFVLDFDDSFVNLLLYGTPGTGKTFICNCIAKDLLDKGKNVLYMTAFDLFKMIEEDRFNRNHNEDAEQSNYIDSLYTADLLILDDLGAEFNTILSRSELFNFINLRLLNRKSTVISTNLTLENLQKTYSDRIISRLEGNYKILEFYGRDIRQQKKRKGITK